MARVASHTPLSNRVLQTLRASAHGSFRTKGRYSAATVRGTVWDTIDRCDGTLTIVYSGMVLVTDSVTHQTIAVHAGHSYLRPSDLTLPVGTAASRIWPTRPGSRRIRRLDPHRRRQHQPGARGRPNGNAQHGCGFGDVSAAGQRRLDGVPEPTLAGGVVRDRGGAIHRESHVAGGAADQGHV